MRGKEEKDSPQRDHNEGDLPREVSSLNEGLGPGAAGRESSRLSLVFACWALLIPKRPEFPVPRFYLSAFQQVSAKGARVSLASAVPCCCVRGVSEHQFRGGRDSRPS